MFYYDKKNINNSNEWQSNSLSSKTKSNQLYSIISKYRLSHSCSQVGKVHDETRRSSVPCHTIRLRAPVLARLSRHSDTLHGIRFLYVCTASTAIVFYLVIKYAVDFRSRVKEMPSFKLYCGLV